MKKNLMIVFCGVLLLFALKISAQESPLEQANLSYSKSRPDNIRVLEAITYDQGKEYLNFIRQEYPDLLFQSDNFCKNENQKVFDYGDVGYFSPTHLRNIKIAGDLRREYGERLSGMHIIAAGNEMEGLCNTLSQISGFSSYTIIGTAESNEAEQIYLNSLGNQNVTWEEISNINPRGKWDLFIGHNVSSLPSSHKEFLKNIIKQTSYGYVICSPMSDQKNIDALSVEELIRELNINAKKGRVVPDRPLSDRNQLLTWQPVGEIKPSVLKEKQICLPPIKGSQNQSAVTYNFSGGRFGDNLIAYFHAKWIAMEYGLPFLYKQFPYSDLLNLHNMDQPVSFFTNHKHTRRISEKSQIATAPPSSLIILPYFPESKFEYDIYLRFLTEKIPYFVIDWEDPKFHKEVIECLTPIVPVDTLPLPEGFITVAVHVRRGGAYESYADVAKIHPLKCPPDSYYISQIQTIAKIFKDQPLYVYIFTDDLNPQAIAEKYAQVIQDSHIVFNWQPKSLAAGVFQDLYDFYSIGKFDCLVRSMSNFSVMASKLGNYQVMVTPTHAYFDTNGQIVIDQLEITFRDNQQN